MTSDKVRVRQVFHVNGIDAPPTTCLRSPKKTPLRVCDCQKEKGSEIDASPQLPNGCFSVARSIKVTMRSMVGTARSVEGQLSWWLKSRVLMHAYATRGLGFLVRNAQKMAVATC